MRPLHRMSRAYKVEFDSQVDVIPVESDVEKKMEFPPDHTLYFEASGSERFPTFSVHLVMEKEMSQRIFQTESEALQCIQTLYPILSMEPGDAVQAFHAWSP